MSNYIIRTSASQLKSAANMVYRLMLRDADEFGKYNIGTVALEEYRNLIEEFETFVPDKIMRAEQSAATAAKNKIRTEALNYLNIYTNWVGMFNNKHPHTLLLPILKNIYRIDHQSLHLQMHQLAQTGEAQDVSMLSPDEQSMLQTLYTRIKELAQALQDATTGQHEAIKRREQATGKRQKLSRALHDATSNYAGLGRALWQQTSPAKAQDYRITRM